MTGTSNYIDGYVLAVPISKLDAYRKIARIAGEVWRDHGALEYTECIADDLQPGEQTSFARSVKLRDDETVIFAWIVYESREKRDEVNAKAMKDPRLAGMKDPGAVPFDTQRLYWGGFRTLIHK